MWPEITRWAHFWFYSWDSVPQIWCRDFLIKDKHLKLKTKVKKIEMKNCGLKSYQEDWGWVSCLLLASVASVILFCFPSWEEFWFCLWVSSTRMLILLPVVYSDCWVSSSLVLDWLGGIYWHFMGGPPGSLLKNSGASERKVLLSRLCYCQGPE